MSSRPPRRPTSSTTDRRPYGGGDGPRRPRRTVADNLAINCGGSDAVSGIVDLLFHCPSDNVPAWTVGLGPHTLVGSAEDYAGNVGTGFSQRTLKELGAQLDALTSAESAWDLVVAASQVVVNPCQGQSVDRPQPSFIARV